jgi:hypothetical protein
MAIQLDLEHSQYGVAFKGAYFRIVTVSISRNTISPILPKLMVMIDVAGYATQPTNDNTRDIDFRRYHVPLLDIEVQEGSAFLDKCYTWVMSQPDMANSVGV